MKLQELLHGIQYRSENGLAEKIWQVIEKRQKNKRRWRFFAFTSVGLISLGGLWPAFLALQAEISQSGFYDYFSLIIREKGLVFSFWRELALSLAESLPVMSLALVLSLFFVLFLSVRYLLKTRTASVALLSV